VSNNDDDEEDAAIDLEFVVLSLFFWANILGFI